MTLASAMGAAERRLREVEAMIEAMLNGLFTDWKGWQFVNGIGNRYGIDVYEVATNIIAVRALFGAGFTSVCLHRHKAARLITCTCRTHDAY